MKWRFHAVALLGLAGLLGVGCSLTDSYVVQNQTDDYVLVRLERLPCEQVNMYANTGWSVVNPRSNLSGRTVSFGQSCIIVANAGRTSITTAAFGDGDEYIVRSAGNRISIQRLNDGESKPPFPASSRASTDAREHVSPKLLWVIGLPAALSAVYLAFVAASFAGSFLRGPKQAGAHQPPA